MYIKIHIQLKKVPKCATLERLLAQELSLFEAGSIEVTAGHLFLMLPVNTAMFSLSLFKLKRMACTWRGECDCTTLLKSEWNKSTLPIEAVAWSCVFLSKCLLTCELLKVCTNTAQQFKQEAKECTVSKQKCSGNLGWQNAIAKMWLSQNSRDNLVHSAMEISEDCEYFRYRFYTAC